VSQLVGCFEGAPQEVDGMFLKPVDGIQDWNVFTRQRRSKSGWRRRSSHPEAEWDMGSEIDDEESVCTTVPSGDDEEKTPRTRAPRSFQPIAEKSNAASVKESAGLLRPSTQSAVGESASARLCTVLSGDEAEDEDKLAIVKASFAPRVPVVTWIGEPCPRCAARCDGAVGSAIPMCTCRDQASAGFWFPYLRVHISDGTVSAFIMFQDPRDSISKVGARTKQLCIEAASSTKDSVQELTGSRRTQVVLLGASGGAAALGGVGGAIGCASGGTLGAIVGLAAAPLTLGLSVPLGAVAGSCTGFCAGAVGGSAAGSVGGGLLGWAGYSGYRALSGVRFPSSGAKLHKCLTSEEIESELRKS